MSGGAWWRSAIFGEASVQRSSSEPPAYEIVFDGGSLGNPGQGYGSFELRSPTGKTIKEKLTFGDQVTNNQAEYLTLVAALERLLGLLGERAQRARLIVRGDSQLVVRQLLGQWKVRHPELKPLHAQALGLLRQIWLLRTRVASPSGKRQGAGGTDGQGGRESFELRVALTPLPLSQCWEKEGKPSPPTPLPTLGEGEQRRAITGQTVPVCGVWAQA
ncbi:MAG: hypothetical protein KatS3mg059_0871 [Thermomicrobiales bacterium]|nr:MAG: hypothetical protein KatS3mg059_0871 [Thermomicrobiales bacterium]